MCLVTEKKSLVQLELFIPPRTKLGPEFSDIGTSAFTRTNICSGWDKNFELGQRFFFCDQGHGRCWIYYEKNIPGTQIN